VWLLFAWITAHQGYQPPPIYLMLTQSGNKSALQAVANCKSHLWWVKQAVSFSCGDVLSDRRLNERAIVSPKT